MKNRIVGAYEPATWYGDVKLDGHLLEPGPSQKVYNHSVDGFAWGYVGSGPAQLALAILLRVGLPPVEAVRLHQQFVLDFLAKVESHAPFAIEVDILAWVVEHSPAPPKVNA